MVCGKLVIFARYPTPGQVKTRLIPALGKAGAAALQDRMTRHTLHQVCALGQLRAVEIEVRFSGANAAEMAMRYGAELNYVPQGDGDLGTRLTRAAENALCIGERPVILLGTDCPAATADVLSDAIDALLAGHDLVLGPAADGGYYLIGMSRFFPELFEHISWSTEHVLAQTLATAERLGLSRVLLAVLPDIDRPQDLPVCSSALPPE